MIDLGKSSWYQQILEEGRQIGLQEAHEERRRQATFRHVLLVLSHCFDEMPQELEEDLQRLDSSSLETLFGVALSAASLQEFRQHPLLGES